MLKTLFSLALAIVFAHPALADEASVKKAIEAKIGGKVGSVTKTSYLGLYEIYADGQVFYTDEKVTVILAGSLIDGKTMKNVTAERMQKLSAINFSELPLDLAIKQVRGDGKRVFATFEDPNCGYCKRLAKDLAEMDNITIYTVLYPVLGSDSVVKSRNIWCAKDQVATWNNWMLKAEQPATAECEQTTTIDKNIALGQSMRITGTPTLFLQDGTRIGGYLPKDQLEVAIADATAKAKEETVQTTQ